MEDSKIARGAAAWVVFPLEAVALPRGLRQIDRLGRATGLSLGASIGGVVAYALASSDHPAGLLGGALVLGGAAALAFAGEPVFAPAPPWPSAEQMPEKAAVGSGETRHSESLDVHRALLDMVPIPGGEFLMGSSPASDPNSLEDERPLRQVQISPFFLARVPVTQAQYQQVLSQNPGSPKSPDLPVNNVAWWDAVRFCNALSEREGYTRCYDIVKDAVRWNQAADGYRLPTEAEWEYAARVDSTTPFPFPTDELTKHAWFGENGGAIRPVGLKRANPFGLHDLFGNVWEWCWDWYARYQVRPPAETVDAVLRARHQLPGLTPDNDPANNFVIVNPTGPLFGTSRVLRGGSAWNEPRYLRAACRLQNPVEAWLGRSGFRCARSDCYRGPQTAVK